MLNAPYGVDEVWDHLPASAQHTIIDRQLEVFVVDAASIAAELGLGGRINTVMQACFFALADVIPQDEAVEAMKRSIGEVYGRRGRTIVDRNHGAIDQALEAMVRVDVPSEQVAMTPVRWTSMPSRPETRSRNG